MAKTAHLLNDSAATLDFLMKKFNGYKRKDKCIVLPRLGLTSPYGPYDYERDHPVSYGRALRIAMSGMGREPHTVTIGGYNEGLTIFDADDKPVFNVGDAFVVGGEPILGDHYECARCAYEIVKELMGDNVLSDTGDVIVGIATTRVNIDLSSSSYSSYRTLYGGYTRL